MQHHNEPRPGLSINQWRKEVAHASQPETLLPSPPADMTSPRKLRSSLASTPEAQSSEYVSQTTWTSQHVITKLTADYSERCAVGPSDLYTKTPRHVPLIYGTDSRMTDDEGEKTPGQEISKMIDWSLVLDLSSSDEEKMDAAFAKLNVHERSLNQSLSYIKRSPLVVHLEIKKQQPGNSPEVHIAIWASAALKKKSWHGWDTSLPMPAITVEGHRWDWYLLMAAGKGLLMLGPSAMGSTSDLTGVWQILYRLKILADWGATTYKRWFDDHVITWAESTIPTAGQREFLCP